MPEATETTAPTRTQSILNAWRLNTDDQIAVIIEAEGPVAVNVQAAELVSKDGIHYVHITATGIPDYTHHISQAEAEFLETRPRAATDFRHGHPLVGSGDTVDFGEDVGYASTGCLDGPGTGYGFWPPGPTCPSPQHWEARFPVDPTQATESTATGLGTIGLWVNGVAVFNWGDGMSWSNQNTWRSLAPFAEIYDLDICPGHSAFGTYHHHSHPTCLAVQLGDNGTAHSPVYGFAADGVPIAGPWVDTGILARSSWTIRDYDDPTSPTGCGTAGVRSCLLVNRYDPDAGTRPTDYPGPNTTAQVRTMSGNELTAFAGYYAEDWYFDAKLNDGSTVSLDAHNGHFGSLPGFTDPTYHYHVTRAVDPATTGGYREIFPFYIGPILLGKNPRQRARRRCPRTSRARDSWSTSAQTTGSRSPPLTSFAPPRPSTSPSRHSQRR